MHVVVTGASGGIGAALAEAFAARGCDVGLIARRGAELEQVAERARTRGVRAACAVADVTDAAATASAVRTLVEALGPVDRMVANAGIGTLTAATRFDAAKATEVMRVNFDGVVHAFAAVLPSMLERRSGGLAAVSSIAGWRALPGQAAYCASKAAVSMLLDAFRIDLAPYGIHVTSVHPGFVDTPMLANAKHPTPFRQTPAAAADRIAHGVLSGRRRVDFPFPLVAIAAAGSALPGMVWDSVLGRLAPVPPPRSGG